MQDHGSRLVGLDGMAVRSVDEVGDQLDLEVELVAHAGCCPGCGRGSLTVKDRPVVRVRDLPVAGRPTWLVWRKRRLCCEGCRHTFTETHPEVPARQRVTARFRRRLLERVRGGAAHAEVAREEDTTAIRSRARSTTAATGCRPLARSGRGGCRSMRRITAAATSSRR
jgi:transposase